MNRNNTHTLINIDTHTHSHTNSGFLHHLDDWTVTSMPKYDRKK